ncbi:hypothetical protein VTN31DRAFT_2100 [Thermomyces dupontii]|uniref:uncharacterized protein n=1 Tax=Talaromyces thermophilus TaxID=28565 RepID=UPI003742160D
MSETTTTTEDLYTHLTSTPSWPTLHQDLHATLLTALQRSGWTERVRTLALELLRAGRCERFDELFDAVLAKAEGRTHPSLSSSSSSSSQVNGNGNGAAGGGGGGEFEAEVLENTDLRIPSAVVELGVKMVREVLRSAESIELEDDGEEEEEEEEEEEAEAEGEGEEQGKKEEDGERKGELEDQEEALEAEEDDDDDDDDESFTAKESIATTESESTVKTSDRSPTKKVKKSKPT